MGHKFTPANWERLVSAERRKLLDPDVLVASLGIAPGDVVADIGAGPGFFTLPLAERVGAEGRVHALDVSPEMLATLRSRGIPPQVDARLMEERHVTLPDASVDLALLAFVFHELDAPAEVLRDIRRVLRPGGRLALLEWVPKAEEIGPPLAERIPLDEAERRLTTAGFGVTERRSLNRSQYLLLATSPGPAPAA